MSYLNASALLPHLNRGVVHWGKMFHCSSLAKFHSNSLLFGSTSRSRLSNLVSCAPVGKDVGSIEVSQEEDMKPFSWPDKKRPRVCILGGGFGGLYTALRLESLTWPEDKKPQVILIDQSERFVFKPMLYELLTGEVDAWEIAPRFSDLLANTGVQFLKDRVKVLSPCDHVGTNGPNVSGCGGTVQLESGLVVEYDWLVLSLGAEPKLDIIPGAVEYAIISLPMARTPSSFTHFLRRPSPKLIQNPNQPLRNIASSNDTHSNNNNNNNQPLHSTDIINSICSTIKSKPRWETTLLSDFPTVTFFDPTFLNQLFLHQKNVFLSLRLLYWLCSSFGYSPHESTCSFMFNSLLEHNAVNAVKIFLGFTKYVPGSVGFELYVKCLCESGMVEDALQVFDEMLKRGVCPVLETWNCVLQGCVKYGYGSVVWRLYGEMMELGVDVDVCTVDCLIEAFCLEKNVLKGYELFRQMLNDGFVPHKVCFEKLIFEFILDRKYSRVSAILHIMIAKGVDPDLYTYQQIIHALCLKRMQREGLRIFNDLKDRGYAPDRIMYTTMIHGLCKIKWFGEARKLWFEMIRKGIKPNLYTYNTLLYGYFKIGDVENALNFYKEMQDKGYSESVVAYNTVISGLCSHGRTTLAFQLFNQMSPKNVSKDVVTYNAMIRGLCKEGKLAEGLTLLHELVDCGLQPSAASYGPLIEKLYELKRIDEVKILWNEMQEKNVEPASVCINDDVIIGLSNEGYVAAGIYWLAYTVKNRLIPHKETFENLIGVLSQKDMLDVGQIALGHMFKIGYVPSFRLDAIS